MKFHRLAFAALLLAAASALCAQSGKGPDPDAIVKELYQIHNSGAALFNQTTDRAIVDRFFRKDLADPIWKDAVAAKGELGALDFDPLIGLQDADIKDFKIGETGWGGDSKFGGDDQAVVQITFKDGTKEHMVSFQFEKDKQDAWKIYDIRYSDGSMLSLVFNEASAAAANKGSSQQCDVDAYVSDQDRNGLNVRQTADSKSKVVGKIRFDSEGTIVHLSGWAGNDGWVKVTSAETIAGDRTFSGEGWVSGNMLAICTRGYGTKGVKVYATQQDGSKVLGTIPAEAEVKVVSCHRQKMKVKYKNLTGWLEPEDQCASPVTTCN